MFPELCLIDEVICADDVVSNEMGGHSNGNNATHQNDRKQMSCVDMTEKIAKDGDCSRVCRSIVIRRSAADCLLDADHHAANAPAAIPAARDLVVIQDDGLTDYYMSRLVMRVGYSSLTSLYVVDCPQAKLDDGAAEMLASSSLYGGGARLRTLVLSRTGQRRLPAAVFRIASLETLKVDHNRLSSIPADIGRLTALKVFCFGGQRPRGLRTLPVDAMRTLTALEVLSFSDNRIDSIDEWIGSLTQLRVLLCARNRICCLPVATLNELKQLNVVDVRHNRIRSVARCSAMTASCLSSSKTTASDLTAFISLLDRLRRFDCDHTSIFAACGLGGGCCSTRHLLSSFSGSCHQRRIRDVLIGELELRQHLLAVAKDVVTSGGSGVGGVVREITVAVVGATHAGKTTLVEALCSERGVCPASRSDGNGGTHASSHSTAKRSGNGEPSVRTAPAFDVRHFEFKPTNDETSKTTTCFVSAIIVSNDLSFQLLINRFHVDLFLLVVDLASFDCVSVGGSGAPQSNSGSRHSTYNNNNNNTINNHHRNFQQAAATPNAASDRHYVSRHVTRLRMWLRALGEAAPDMPVLLVGTHAADLHPQQSTSGSTSGGGADIWREFCEQVLGPARREHAKCYDPSPNCVLCSPIAASELRQTYVGGASTLFNTVKTKPSSTAGYVDLSVHSSQSNPVNS
jgi:hypothetical protein